MATAEVVLGWLVAVCLVYLAVVYGSYLVLAVVGLYESAVRRRDRAELRTVARSRLSPPVSVLLPAYDEEPSVVATVRSLLSLDYPEFEVVVVNDGSRDATLERLRIAFRLEPVQLFPRVVHETAAVRAVYRSARFPQLVVVDKENGGKADALNAALNVARHPYVCGVDADAVFDPDALSLAMCRVLDDPERVIGVTAPLAIAYDPTETMAQPPGRRRVPRRLLVAYQHLDYTRAFFNNRLAWSRLDFMLCAVGAFQLWRRDVLDEVGGFDRGFTCEDIELTFRVHERFLREGRDYRIVCLPDTVGATEGPDTVRKLVSQRERWQRVISETVWHYRGMLLGRRYRTVGLVGVPYYVLSELLAPAFELLSLVALALAWALGVVDWTAFAGMLALLAFANGVLAALALLAQELQPPVYRLRDVVRLLLLAPLDLFLYRPVIAWARAKGTLRFLRGDRSWNRFERNARAAAA